MSNSTLKQAKPKKLIKKSNRRILSTPLWKKVASWSGKAILVIATLLAFLPLLPRVTAAVSDPVDSNDPFSSSVTITNTGYIPLDSVTANISWGTIKFMGPNGPATLLGDEGRQAFGMSKWQTHDLGLDDKFTVSLNDFFRGNRNSLLEAEVAVTVRYELPLIHWQREKRFPVFAKRASNGNFYWYADTLPARPK